MKTIRELTFLLIISYFLVPLNLYSQYAYCKYKNPCPSVGDLSAYTLSGGHISQTHLKYFIGGNSKVSYDVLKTGFLMAFNTWSNEVPFTCEEVFNEADAFIKILSVDHNTYCSVYDYESTSIAASYVPGLPCNGTILLNADVYDFVLDPNAIPRPVNPRDIVYVLIHEMGHTFGLCHSNKTSSVMYEEENPIRNLSQDDKNGIHAIYNAIVAVQNKFENPDKTYSIGGGIVSVDDHDYLTENLPNKEQKFPFVSGDTHKFEAKDQSYNGIQRKFNPYSNGGWLRDNNFPLGFSPLLSKQVTSGTYTAIYRSKVNVNMIAQTEFDGNSFLNTGGQEFFQYDPFTLNFPSIITIGSNSYKNAGIYRVENGALNENGTFTPFGNGSVTSLYKIPNKSNTSTAFSNTSQRKFVRTDNGYLHLVYESMNHIWYERSTDNGSSWQIMNGGRYLDQGATQSKLPSIASIYNDIAIVYQEEHSGYYQIKMARFDENSILRYTRIIYYGPEPNEYGYSTELYPPLYSTNADPVIAFNASSAVLVCWKKEIPEDPSFSGIWYKFGQAYIDPYGALRDDSRWFQEDMIPGTTISSCSPTVSRAHLGESFAVAWDRGGYYTAINFAMMNYSVDESGDDNPGYVIYNIAQQTISNWNYCQYHHMPSLAVIPSTTGEKLELGWVGERVYSENGVQKSEKVALYRRNTFSNSTLTWNWDGTTWMFGYGSVRNVNVNTTSTDGVIGWNEETGACRYVRSSNLYGTRTFSLYGSPISGRGIQINNGSDLSTVCGLTLNNSAIPYSFKKSAAVSSLGKTGGKELSSRTAIARLDSAAFFISSSGFLLDGKHLGFTAKCDSTKSYDTKSISEVLSTKTFSPEANSSIRYELEYGTLDTLYSMKVLSKSEGIQCRLELQDTDNGSTLKVLEKFSLDKHTMKGTDWSKKSASGNLDLKKFAGRNLRLKLVIENNLNAEWGLMERVLNTEDEKEIEKITPEKIVDYALNQNYPNPFNPSTVISFQIPKASKVSLKIYDMLGKEVRTLVDEVKGEGKYSVEFNASNLPSGIYIYEIRANDFVNSGKMMLLK